MINIEDNKGLLFKNYFDEITFADELYAEVCETGLETIVVSNAELINYLFLTFATDYNFDVGLVDYACGEFNNGRPYMLIIIPEDNTVCVEQAKTFDGRIVDDYSDVAYLDINNCDQEMVDFYSEPTRQVPDRKVILFDPTGEEIDENAFATLPPEWESTYEEVMKKVYAILSEDSVVENVLKQLKLY